MSLLLLFQSGAAAQVPLVTQDRSVAKGLEFPISLRTYIETVNPNLIGKDALPVRNRQVDLPWLPGTPYPLSLRTFINPVEVNLIGKDALPFRQLDWPLPKQNPAQGQTFLENLQLTTLGFVQAPFAYKDWPVPQIAPYANGLRTFLNPVEINLIGQDVLPFRNAGRMVPGVGAPLQGPATLSENLLLTTLAVTQAPFVGQFAPIFASIRFTVGQAAQNLLETTLGGVVVPPVVVPPPHTGAFYPTAEDKARERRSWRELERAEHDRRSRTQREMRELEHTMRRAWERISGKPATEEEKQQLATVSRSPETIIQGARQLASALTATRQFSLAAMKRRDRALIQELERAANAIALSQEIAFQIDEEEAALMLLM